MFESKRNRNWLNTFMDIVPHVLLVGLTVFVIKLQSDMNKVKTALSLVMESKLAVSQKIQLKSDQQDPQLGSDSARVVMTIISDFECGYCKDFAKDILPKLKKEYVDTGKLKIIFKNLPLPTHNNAWLAAEAAACANAQGKFWVMHDYLFDNQTKFSTDFFFNWARTAGLDTAAYKSCLEKHSFQQKIEEDITQINAAGIEGTPAIVINGQLTLGIRPYAYFTGLIDKELNALQISTDAQSCK